jgi:hypothetical protein
MRIKLGLPNRSTRMFLGALAATGLMFILFAGTASAQVGAPEFPFPPPSDNPFEPPPDATENIASKALGTTTKWTKSARTLAVRVSCARDGRLAIFRKGVRIGRTAFACSTTTTPNKVVRVTITRAANKKLSVGAIVRARVASSGVHTKKLRVVRQWSALSARSSASSRYCSDYYWSTYIGGNWPTNGGWWEAWCYDQGLYGSHIAEWWDYYYWAAGNPNYWRYYGTWIRNAADGCWRFWHPDSGAHYGHWCPQK